MQRLCNAFLLFALCADIYFCHSNNKKMKL